MAEDNINRTIWCERCEMAVSEVFECEVCGMLICDKCQVGYNQFSQIDYNCCKVCATTEEE